MDFASDDILKVITLKRLMVTL